MFVAVFNSRLLQCGGLDLLFQLGAQSSLAAIRGKVARALAVLMARRSAYRKAIFDRGVVDLLDSFFVASTSSSLAPAAAPSQAAPAVAAAAASPDRLKAIPAHDMSRSSVPATRGDASPSLRRRHSDELAVHDAAQRDRLRPDDVGTIVSVCHMIVSLLERDDGIGSAAAQRIAAGRIVARVANLALSPADDDRLHAAIALALEHLVRWRPTCDVACKVGVLRPLILIALDADETIQLCAARSLACLAGVSQSYGVRADERQRADGDGVRARIATLAAGGVLLPLLELCRATNDEVRTLGVQIMERVAEGQHERLQLARHCALDTLVPILASSSVGDIRNVLHIVDLIAGDAACATEARLGAFDDGGIGSRLVRSVARVLAQHGALERACVLTLQTLFFAERDWTATHTTPLWRALRDGDRRVAVDAMKKVVQATEARIEDGGARRETDASDKAFLNALQQQCLPPANNSKLVKA